MVILGWNNPPTLRADGLGCLPFIFYFSAVSATSSISNEQHRGLTTNYTSPVYAIARLVMLLQDNKQHY
jgi:hypothetical protein